MCAVTIGAAIAVAPWRAKVGPKELPVLVNVQPGVTITDDQIAELVSASFDFRLAGILKKFQLRYLPARHPEGFCRKLAAYGHFGREEPEFTWENTDKVDLLRAGGIRPAPRARLGELLPDHGMKLTS